MIDVLTLLAADHNRVRGLFKQFEEAKSSGDEVHMTELAARITEELDIHTRVEEEIFYPWAGALNDEIREVVDEGVEEHHVVKVLVEEMATVEPASDEWLAKATVVMENVEHHATEEEDEMFPAIRGASDASERREVGAQVDKRKGELGAPPLEERLRMRMAELRILAREQSIPGRSKMSHDELAAAVAPRKAS